MSNLGALPAIPLSHLQYHRWASQRLLEVVRTLPPEQLYQDRGSSFQSVLGTLNHIFLADQTWWARVQGNANAQLSSYTPPATLAQLESQWMCCLDLWVGWAKLLPPEGWNKKAPYRNAQGTEFQTPLWQIVLHVANHGTAYRGQASGLLRQGGHTPPGLDLIAYYRQTPAEEK